MLINELFIDSINADGVRPIYSEAVSKLTTAKIFKQLTDTNKDKLYTFVVMKHSIAEYVWNILAGFLVTSVTYNQIINSTCINSSTVMKARHDAYEAEETKKLEDKRKIDAMNITTR